MNLSYKSYHGYLISSFSYAIKLEKIMATAKLNSYLKSILVRIHMNKYEKIG